MSIIFAIKKMVPLTGVEPAVSAPITVTCLEGKLGYRGIKWRPYQDLNLEQ